MAQVYDSRGQLRRSRGRTHAEAVKALQRLQADVVAGRFDHARSPTLQSFAERWLREHVAKQLEPKTYRAYAWILNCHVLPALGKKRLDAIKRNDVQAMANGLFGKPAIAKSRKRNAVQKEIGRTTVLHAVRVLHTLFESAIRDELCSVNPAKRIDLSKPPPKIAPISLSEPEIRALVDVGLEDSPVRALVLFLLATGTRNAEARGLRWCDVNFENQTVRIAGQLQRINSTLTYKPSTKTNQDREIAVPNWLIDELRSLQSRHLIEGVSDPDGIVFLTDFGSRIDQKYISKYLHRACVDAGIKPVSPHKLRHTYATRALAKGLQLHDVQKALGHQQVALTANLYGHASIESSRRIAEVLGPVIDPRG